MLCIEGTVCKSSAQNVTLKTEVIFVSASQGMSSNQLSFIQHARSK